METCIKCNKKEVVIKKRKLCTTCYHAQRRQNKEVYRPDAHSGQSQRNIRHRAEIAFIAAYFDHKEWVYEPAIFYMGNAKYAPDFYDARRNVFIEVAGSRQAYHQNKDKYDLFKKTYPKINYEIRLSDGSLLTVQNGRCGWEVEA